MDIDERLETLAERREALAQSVELLRDSMYEAAREMRADHDRFMADMVELRGSVSELRQSARDHETDHPKFRLELADLRDSVQLLVETSANLVKISDSHERGLGRIESAA
ncbi:MAG: hypothetical protein ABSB15_03790 [Bryobacteraceae bacterium]|jgi:hypothetical protein